MIICHRFTQTFRLRLIALQQTLHKSNPSETLLASRTRRLTHSVLTHTLSNYTAIVLYCLGLLTRIQACKVTGPVCSSILLVQRIVRMPRNRFRIGQSEENPLGFFGKRQHDIRLANMLKIEPTVALLEFPNSHFSPFNIICLASSWKCHIKCKYASNENATLPSSLFPPISTVGYRS